MFTHTYTHTEKCSAFDATSQHSTETDVFHWSAG